ncbi:phage-related tail protein [Yersinia intermedia]|uniref:phage tail protein n=1 Tax=Yersinia intermedia TaxID=631 RepID=UPI0005E02F8A|nr:phage tail protein [Yersinia intermedia]CQD74049.1 phage-related tail protein [Yersinia intermedia]
MMMCLGFMVFMLQTLPYQTLQRNTAYRWPTNDRIGLRAAPQFLGPGDEKITLSGTLMPEITGGKLSLLSLRVMADQGRAWSLIDGSGTIYGMFVIESVNETHTEFFSNGSARSIDFTLSLLRVDESLTAMLGDLRTQTDGLVEQANSLTDYAKNYAGGLF